MSEEAPLEQVCKLLDQNKLSDFSRELRGFWGKLDSKNRWEREVALQAITERCHIKAYGDLNIAGTSDWAWPNLLGKLAEKAKHRKRKADLNSSL